MNEQRIREIASQCSDFAEQIPYFRGIEDGLTWEAKIQKARDFKFAELIVRECAEIGDNYQDILEDDPECFNCRKVAYGIVDKIKEHFGVEE